MPRPEVQTLRRVEEEHRITWWFERPRPMGEGPWTDEPDKIQWIDPVTGLDCLMVRSMMSGAWCGYVGVPPGHPLYGEHDEAEEHLYPHGGITFGNVCEPGEPEFGVCHVASAGAVEKPYWVGFDCAHAGDYSPAMEELIRGLPIPENPLLRKLTSDWDLEEHYWTVDEVQLLTAELAGQVASFPASGATEESA